MNGLLITLLIYLSYLFIWFSINLIAYFCSLAFKKQSILAAVNGISFIILIIFNWAVGIGLFLYSVSLLLNGEILRFVLMILIGIGMYQGFIAYLQLPFVFVSEYFTSKIGKLNFKEVITGAEIQASNSSIVKTIDPGTRLSVQMARYFLVFYTFNLIMMIISPAERVGVYGAGYITKPLLQIVGGTIIIGLPYTIYHKLRFKSFLPKDKRYFFISVWKLSLIIFGGGLLILYLWSILRG